MFTGETTPGGGGGRPRRVDGWTDQSVPGELFVGTGDVEVVDAEGEEGAYEEDDGEEEDQLVGEPLITAVEEEDNYQQQGHLENRI